ncbi:carbohydrate ABC transporter permease [Pandoraea apista]|uniref:Sugar ABC transporter permease n=1 Tax=Pandoraea apista TaxID=93218 RepID=A0ABX9ZM14_9BURK|nr:sugar ABC transporter permease [Pandoraea apista]AJE99216.1 ABC transporter permease [Pandoraea apista]AKH73321.1 ABC transporter permease [Pandoraea apista]AKI61867.1 ABC transporter permease [Pandoraea apista]PTD99135.1 sugar ABC transporter permease [Pandoraea apista]RRJ30610.1 sugar ABC transporter permease [Pandoraea apista]
MNRSSASWVPWLLLLPALVLLVAFTHYPAVATLWHSFFSTARAGATSVFVGAENYQLLAEDAVFWQALRNNLLFALITVPAAIALSIAMALWVHRQVPGRALLRLAYFTPAILPMIAVANIWLFFYTPQYGLIAQISQAFGWGDHNWLGQPGTALPALMVVTIWKEAGFFMIFYLAALQQISPTLAEAAALEGASRWQYFRRVQWPLLMPTTVFVVINAVINAFRLVDHVVVMTRGGPDNATQLLLFYIYQVAFSFWDTSYAAALTVVLLTLLAIVAFVKFRLLDSRTHYQ